MATAFLDESGAISKDRFFAIGLLKASEPSRVLRRIQKLRDRHHWYNEIKHVDVTLNSLPLYESVVDECLDHGDVEYFCFVADRTRHDPVARFGSQWGAYLKLADLAAHVRSRLGATSCLNGWRNARHSVQVYRQP